MVDAHADRAPLDGEVVLLGIRLAETDDGGEIEAEQAGFPEGELSAALQVADAGLKTGGAIPAADVVMTERQVSPQTRFAVEAGADGQAERLRLLDVDDHPLQAWLAPFNRFVSHVDTAEDPEAVEPMLVAQQAVPGDQIPLLELELALDDPVLGQVVAPQGDLLDTQLLPRTNGEPDAGLRLAQFDPAASPGRRVASTVEGAAQAALGLEQLRR